MKFLLNNFNGLKYLLGRFYQCRRSYSFIRKTLQGVKLDRQTLLLCDNYQTNYKVLHRSQEDTVFSDRSEDDHITFLRQTAFSTGLRLSENTQKSLIEAASCRSLVASGSRRVFTLADAVADPSLRDTVAIATIIDSSDLACIQDLAASPILLNVVTTYLGYAPRRVSSWFFWSFANQLLQAEREAVYQTIQYHYDVHGLNFMYVNFYLLDTDADSGAHVLISASHRQKRLRQLLGSARLMDEQALSYYGAERIEVITGTAGSGFFEDASCYHKALPPKTSDRLMLQLRYS
ncbi:hypothetical protein [Nostoc sp. C117]|uniref:hypothetical protein n=1 Tax=Nostoc sp. C117 TaxID=3349875 RepID=UPI00370DA194